MRLECIKYRWLETTDPEEINFYGATPTQLETVDLVDYLERDSLSDVEYTFENKTDNENILYIEASSLSMNCRNLTRGQTIKLQDFFEVYSNDNLMKWKVNYYDDSNTLIYTGIIYKDGVKFPNPKATILNILTVGYEREFKEYYKAKPLRPGSEIGWHVRDPINYTGLKVNDLTIVLGRNFPGIEIPLGQSLFLLDYAVLEWGYTVAPDSHMLEQENFFHVKCGYRNFADAGVSRFDFFNGMMQAMGWVWYFYLGKLYIKQRYDLNLNLNVISADRFINHSIESTFNNKADVIIIEDGEYFDNGGQGANVLSGISIFRNSTNKSYNLGGDRSMVFSEKLSYNNYERPFRNIIYSGANVYLNTYYNWTFARRGDSNEKEYIIDKHSIGTTSPYSIDIEKLYYPHYKYMRISPVTNPRDYSSGYDKENPRADTGAYYGNGNFLSISNQPVTSSHVLYNGNPANCIIKYLGSLINKYQGYESYCNSQTFKNNFKTLLRSSASVNIKASVKELITNPFQNFQITDYSYSNEVYNKIFFLNKLGFNSKGSGITNLELYTI